MFIQLLLIFCWLSFMVKSDAYYISYLIIGMSGCLCLYKNQKEEKIFQNIKRNHSAMIIAFLYSVSVLAANYKLFTESTYQGNLGKIACIIHIGLLFSGGYLSLWNILIFLTDRMYFLARKKKYYIKPHILFGSVLIGMAIINIAVLFLTEYPGILTSDSISQVRQILTGKYSNHHPFYHTMIIKLFLSIGMYLFHDMNSAIALYCVFQSLFMASCFSYAVLTLYQMNCAPKVLLLCTLWYAVMPFHIMYSITVWKDVMFGGMMILFLASIYRIFRNMGKGTSNYSVMTISGMGLCLFRSNGWFAFLLTFICFGVLLRKQRKQIFFLLAGILVCSFIVKHPVLSYLDVRQPDAIEALSIPIQQIARVIADKKDLTKKQEEMLSKIVDIREISESYKPYISDPIKKIVRDKGNQTFITDNKLQYLKLYLEIGLSHPIEYIKAWIDETKGYWNGGYAYWRWATDVDENQLGIYRYVQSERVSKVLNWYLWLYSKIDPLQIFLCIGFHVWLIVLLIYICIIRKCREEGFLCIPNLAVIGSLIISTPVYSEFRYAYSIFCSIPFLVVVVLASSKVRLLEVYESGTLQENVYTKKRNLCSDKE